LLLLGFSYLAKGSTPKAREDREWLITFSLVMLIFFALMHTIAFLPSALFGGISDMVSAAFNAGNYARTNFNEM